MRFFFFVPQILVRPLLLKYYNEAIIAFVLTSYFIESMHSLEWANFYPSEKHYFLAAETCGTNITHPLSKHFYLELYGFKLIKNFIRNISNDNIWRIRVQSKHCIQIFMPLQDIGIMKYILFYWRSITYTLVKPMLLWMDIKYNRSKYIGLLCLCIN